VAGPSNYYIEVINPHNPNGPKIKAIIPASLYERYYKYSPVDYENLRAAQYVLAHTERIFVGIREYSEGGWCFVGRPIEWYVKEGVVAPFPKDKVFAVYFYSNMVMFDCIAEYADKNDPLSPINWEKRYGGLVWKNIS
jgi:hypothetical protein